MNISKILVGLGFITGIFSNIAFWLGASHIGVFLCGFSIGATVIGCATWKRSALDETIKEFGRDWTRPPSQGSD